MKLKFKIYYGYGKIIFMIKTSIKVTRLEKNSPFALTLMHVVKVKDILFSATLYKFIFTKKLVLFAISVRITLPDII